MHNEFNYIKLDNRHVFDYLQKIDNKYSVISYKNILLYDILNRKITEHYVTSSNNADSKFSTYLAGFGVPNKSKINLTILNTMYV